LPQAKVVSNEGDGAAAIRRIETAMVLFVERWEAHDEASLIT
jgi:hypothetical protein